MPEYLRGTGTDNNECSGLFKEYRKCLDVRVSALAHTQPESLTQRQSALKSRGIDKLLEEAREDNKENDNTYMGRKCKFASGLIVAQ